VPVRQPNAKPAVSAAAPRPRRLTVTRLPPVETEYPHSACAGRAPSAEHAFGTAFAAVGDDLVEVDLKRGDVLRRVFLEGDTARRPAVHFDGAHVLVASGGILEPVFLRVFDTNLQLLRKVELPEGFDVNVVAGDGLAFVAFLDERTHRTKSAAIAVDPDTGAVLGDHNLQGSVSEVEGGSTEIMFHRGRLYFSTADKTLRVEALEPRTLRRVAYYSKRLHPADDEFTHSADGHLAPLRDGVLVTSAAESLELDLALHFRRKLPPVPDGSVKSKPAIDAESGAVLTKRGKLAASPEAPYRGVVKLQEGMWKLSAWQEPIPLDEPLAAFFLGGRGFVLTKNPGLRISVVEGFASAAR
jgi:hypothetical protein